MSFVARTLPSAAGIDAGAFRVHLLPEHLDQVGLKLNDLCEITGENGDAKGYGIAWRAVDKMGTNPKNRPAKLTETLQTAFGIKEGSQIMLYRTDAKVAHADEIVLTDITPNDYSESDPDDRENGRWRSRIAHVLCNCDVFASGITLEITARKGLKKRFFIDHAKSSEGQQGSPNLYYFDDRTTITFNDSGSFQLSDDSSSTEAPLSEKYIGGLHDQLQLLNMRLKRAVGKARSSNSESNATNSSILIHGFEGTGKSLIIDRLQHNSPCRTFTLKKSTLNATSASKNAEIIHGIFKDAKAKQPALILMDNLNKIAPVDDGTYVDAINEGLSGLASSKVLVVATCRSLTDVNNELLADHFRQNIELSIPDQKARTQILDILIHETMDIAGRLSNSIGGRTHGFTGRDLSKLVEVAMSNALDRFDMACEGSESQPSGTVERKLDAATTAGAVAHGGNNTVAAPPNGEQITKEVGMTNGQDSTIDDHNACSPYLAVEDFNAALAKVRPTALREIIFEPPKTTWSDIGGSQEIQESLDKIILYPQTHAKDMVSYSKIPKKGVLLYGPPGCSKTLTAQAIATKYGLNFIAIKGGELISMYVGESERSIRELFRKARAAKPCVIFFDEIDSIASARENGAAKGLNVLTTLLNEMDGFDVLEGVLILAATNKPEALDTAIMRPGRFDAHFYLGLPNTSARSEILQIKAKGAPGAESLDYNALADKTKGYTGAELAKIYDLATDLALERKIKGGAGMEGDGRLRMDDFDFGIEHTRKGVDLGMLEAYDAFRMKAAEG